MVSDLPRVIVIMDDASELESVVTTLRGKLPVEVLPARTPTEALRWEGTREAPLVLYDCAPAASRAHHLRELFPQATLVALAVSGEEPTVEAELEAGAADYVLRDGPGAYLTLLPLKVTRILAPRTDAPGSRFIARLEDSLARSEIRFGTLVQAIPDIVYHLDPRGDFVFVNDAVTMLDYQPADVIGKHFSVILHPEDLPFVSRNHVLKRMKEGDAVPQPKLFDERRAGERRTKGLVVRLMTKPGGPAGQAPRLGDVVSYGVIEATGHYDGGPEMLHGAEGGANGHGNGNGNGNGSSFRGTVGIIHDITLHRRSEEMMRILLQAVDQSPVSVLVMTSDGAVEYVNPLFLREAVLAPDQVVARNVANLTEGERLTPMFRILANTARDGGEWRGELPAASPWRYLYVSPVRSPQNRASHYIAILTG